MFNRQTVFILGAGASWEFGFPLGTSLRDEIRSLMRLEHDGINLNGPGIDILRYAAKKKGSDGREYAAAAKRIYEGLPYFNSIDDFLDHRKDDPVLIEIGKLSVAKIISDHELNSRLKSINEHNNRIVASELTGTWAFKFVKMLVKDRPRADLIHLFQNVTFVTFNYDRSIEQFLCHAILEACDLSLAQSIELISKVPIYHVYGSLGCPPGFQAGKTYGYGGKWNTSEIAEMSGGIRTYTESEADTSKVKLIQNAIAGAEKLVFLGCGFHTQNIEILRPDEFVAQDCEIVATAFGQTPTSVVNIEERLLDLFDTRSDNLQRIAAEAITRGLHNMTCTQIFDEYALGMTD